ncbi:DUF1285 domain-containing protein [Amorphus orientalis]|uniref:DUF1285 domain-containing protein n=1 Tax=Amorphus orientalis TaxID=649198 RepID=A0AAE4AR75_9HYPH|nr:DUF1285 domain-containing protein [Amorphus orientalis]MDQ0313887.1 hypothetical protein [Amorphus orientalis]
MTGEPDNQHDVNTGLSGLEAMIRRAESGGGAAPVEKWDPPHCGKLDIRIARDGLWYYLGTPIGREPLVRLFASVLRRDDDGITYLVTPVEKIEITVDDVPFIGVELHATGTGRDQVLTVRTNVGDVVEIDSEHPLRFEKEADTDGLQPYLLVRGRLEARLGRPLLYELVDLGTTEERDGVDWFGVWSNGLFFPMMRQAELERLAG